MEETPPSTEPESKSPQPPVAGGAMFTRYRRTQLLVLLASTLGFLLYWWAGRRLGIPEERGFEASLLQQSHWPVDLVVTYVLFEVCLILGSLIAGWSWFFAGLFAASVGLVALSARGGPMRYVLFHAAESGTSNKVYLLLALEQCLLFVPVVASWMFLHRRYERALPQPEEPSAGEGKEPSASSLPMSLLAQVIVMGFVVLLFVPTDAKKQVLIGVFIGGFVGSALAEYLFPTRRAGAFFWAGPLVVGLIGYLLAQMSATDYALGVPQGGFAALARPLPLDYASAGVAGALLGYWIGAERPEPTTSILGSAGAGEASKPRSGRAVDIQGSDPKTKKPNKKAG